MSKPTNCISVTKAKELQNNWNTTRAKDIEKAMGSKDVIAVTFNIDQLQQYIDYVKSESAKQGIEKPGIRVYLAAYNNSESDKATVFFNPTEDDTGNSKNNYKVEPLNVGQGGWPPMAY